jgi:hypothetical protein
MRPYLDSIKKQKKNQRSYIKPVDYRSKVFAKRFAESEKNYDEKK